MVIHWHKMLQAGMAYVMLGRSECLQDVYIDKKDYDVSKIRCSPLAKNESDRLEEKAENRKYHTTRRTKKKRYWPRSAVAIKGRLCK